MKIAHEFSPYQSIDLIEFDDLEQGIKLALKYGLTDLTMNLDSTTMLSYIKIDEPPWNLRSKVRRIKGFIAMFNSCVLEHYYKETNALVDAIADIGTDARLVELNVT